MKETPNNKKAAGGVSAGGLAVGPDRDLALFYALGPSIRTSTRPGTPAKAIAGSLVYDRRKADAQEMCVVVVIIGAK
jgi:hypothetical protein